MKLLQRLTTGLFIVTLTTGLLILGAPFFPIAIACIALRCLFEILELKKLRSQKAITYFSVASLCGILACTLVSNTHEIWTSKSVLLLTVSIIIYSLYELYKGRIIKPKHALYQATHTILLLGFTFPFATLIRSQENGIVDAMLLIAIIATTDSCAYFTGKAIGKTKLSPISPNKTIEGTVSGVLCGITTGSLIIISLNLNWQMYTPLICIISIIAPLGDLHESLIKRTYKVKDSSNILPGHGGFYDRMDSYLLNFPIFYYGKLFLTYL